MTKALPFGYKKTANGLEKRRLGQTSYFRARRNGWRRVLNGCRPRNLAKAPLRVSVSKNMRPSAPRVIDVEVR